MYISFCCYQKEEKKVLFLSVVSLPDTTFAVDWAFKTNYLSILSVVLLSVEVFNSIIFICKLLPLPK